MAKSFIDFHQIQRLQARAPLHASLFPCSNITEMRKTHKDAFLKKHNIKLGFMSAFVKAAAYALGDQPAVNAGIDQPQKNENSYLVVSVSRHCFCMFGIKSWQVYVVKKKI